MSKKHYDVKIKVQKRPGENYTYKPAYYRFIVESASKEDAKQAVLKIVTNSFKDVYKEGELSYLVTKSNFIKLEGFIRASSILEDKNN